MILAQSYRLEPEFANESLSLNVYVFRFITIKAVKVEPITLFIRNCVQVSTKKS